MPDDMIGERIRRLRRSKGLTQAALAGERLSESYISLIESGRRQPTRDVLEYLAAALACPVETLQGVGPAEDPAQAELLIRRGEWESDSGQAPSAIGHLQAGVELARRLELPALVTRGRAGQAKALEMSGRLQEAAAIWEKLRREATVDPRNSWAAPATVGLSRCYRELGDLDRAIEVGEEFWQQVDMADPGLSVGLEDLVVVGATLLMAYIELGDRKRTEELSADLIALAESAETPRASGAAYWNAALAAQADGRTAEALRLAEKAQASLALTEDVRNKARLQTALGGLHLRMDRPDTDKAVQLLEAAEPVLRQFGSKVDISYCHTELARARLQTGHFRQARDLAAETLTDLQQLEGDPIEAARTLMVLAAACTALDDQDEARCASRTAAQLLEDAGAKRQAASAWSELAEIHVSLGQSDQAIAAYRKATELLGAGRTAGASVHQPSENTSTTTQPEAS